MTRIAAARLREIVSGIPGNPPMMVVKSLLAVTVTVAMMCPLDGHVTVQSFAGDVLLKTPASVAHWQKRDAFAMTPLRLTAFVAVVSISVVFPLLLMLDAPYCAPARAAFMSDIPV